MEFEVSAELVGIYLEDAREHLAVLDAARLLPAALQLGANCTPSRATAG